MQGKLSAYLCKDKHGNYHFRARIPRRAQPHFNNKAEIKRSLGTDSRREAVRLARAWRVQLDKLLADMERRKRQKEDAPRDTIEWRYCEIADITLPNGATIGKIVSDTGDAEADQRAVTEALNHAVKGVGGLPPVAPQQPTATPGPPLSVAIEEYKTDKLALGCWQPRSADQVAATLRDFLAIVGDQPVTSITKPTIAKYRQALARLPANRSKLRQYRDKSIPEILAMPDVKPANLATVKNNLGRVSPFFAWCVDREYIATSPAAGITKQLPKGRKAKDARDPFTPEELRALFHSDEFKTFAEPYKYWVPLIGLYGGMRIEEACKLRLGDIRQEGGVWCMAIEDAKTPSGWRKVPMHKMLVVLGLPGYAASLEKAGHDRLFPELTKQRDGYGARVSKWFARYRQRCGVGATDYRKCFHSFRHSVIDALRRARVEKARIQAIVGHDPGDTTDGVYGTVFSPGDLKPDIDLLDYGLKHPPCSVMV